MSIHSKLILSVLSAILLASCGKPVAPSSDTKIVGGKVVGPKEHSAWSTVALMTPQGQAFCTGSLITKTFVLTAGHCVDGYEGKMIISFGAQAHVDRRMIAQTKRWVKTVVQHPQYNPDAMQDQTGRVGMNDIALLQLSHPAPEPFRPIAMVPMNAKIHKGERLILAGFGVTKFQGTNPGDRLRKVDTVLMQIRREAREFDFGPTMGKTACNGDSGGPAFVVRRGRANQNSLVLAGVTSRGNFCQDMGTYSDVRLFMPWIKKVVHTLRARG